VSFAFWKIDPLHPYYILSPFNGETHCLSFASSQPKIPLRLPFSLKAMDFIDACKHGRLPIVQFLLDQGADIHAKNDYALRLSACNGHLPIVQVLLEQGADIHADNDGALQLSASSGHLPVVQYLLDQGADIHAENDYALQLSAYWGNLPVVQYLLDHGADIHAEDECALRWSAENRHLHVVQYLLIHGANIGDMSRYTPDIIAFINDFFHKVRKIQHWWLEIYMNPYHPVGRKIINQRYDKLFL